MGSFLGPGMLLKHLFPSGFNPNRMREHRVTDFFHRRRAWKVHLPCVFLVKISSYECGAPEISRFLLELVCWALIFLLSSEHVFVSPSLVGIEFRVEGKGFFPFGAFVQVVPLSSGTRRLWREICCHSSRFPPHLMRHLLWLFSGHFSLSGFSTLSRVCIGLIFFSFILLGVR